MKNFIVGKNYKMRINGSIKPLKVYIEHVLPSIYEDEKLIVYRVWLKHKGYWHEALCTQTEMNMYYELPINKK